MGSGFGSTHLQHHHGLAAPPGEIERLEEERPVPYPFRIGHDDRHLVAIDDPAQCLREIDVAFVAGGDPVPDADAATAR